MENEKMRRPRLNAEFNVDDDFSAQEFIDILSSKINFMSEFKDFLSSDFLFPLQSQSHHNRWAIMLRALTHAAFPHRRQWWRYKAQESLLLQAFMNIFFVSTCSCSQNSFLSKYPLYFRLVNKSNEKIIFTLFLCRLRILYFIFNVCLCGGKAISNLISTFRSYKMKKDGKNATEDGEYDCDGEDEARRVEEFPCRRSTAGRMSDARY